MPDARWIVRPTVNGVLAAASVVAAGSVCWTLTAGAAWTLRQFTVPADVAATSGAYTALVLLAGAVLVGLTAGRRLRYRRAELRAERARWAAAQPELDAGIREKRARTAKAPKPALPRGLGFPIS